MIYYLGSIVSADEAESPYILLRADTELRAIRIGRFSVVGLCGMTIQLISKPFVFTAYIKCLYHSQLAVQIKYSYYNIVDCDWSTYVARLFCKCFPIVTKSSFMCRISINPTVIYFRANTFESRGSRFRIDRISLFLALIPLFRVGSVRLF